MSKQDFLVELGTEELPPKALLKLSKSFQAGVVEGLKKESLAHGDVKSFATPRRLAILVSALDTKQADRLTEKFGPAVKAAFDADGKPTRAADGFAKSCGVIVADLGRASKDGVEKLSFSSTLPGKSTNELLPAIVNTALAKLPIPKRMRWGASRDEFVRPVHWLVMLFGEEVVPSNIMGVESGADSFGHRFHHPDKIHISKASEYEALMLEPGNVIADFAKRRELIRNAILAEGEKLNANTVVDESLLDEVTGLVEYPVALTGKFDELFLQVPSEALILAMKSHQKCFYLLNKEEELLPYFVTVSNIRSNDPSQVIKGNERVIRPRLADAKFFYETDKQATLESRLDQLKKVVFQEKLGTVYDRSLRVANLVKFIASNTGENEVQSERAAMLSKCDLVTKMVGEFADLQGLMGSYYAANDGEPEPVTTAISEQYMPKYAGDDLPSTAIGSILAVADKLDSIVGLFAIGQPPTGSKDPFALRRSAIGVLRIMVENKLDLDLLACIEASLKGFESLEIDADTAENVFEFMLERFRSWYSDEGIPSNVFQSVMQIKPRKPYDFAKRIQAVSSFVQLQESAALAAANKRVSNLLDKVDAASLSTEVSEALLEDDAEKILFQQLRDKELNTMPLFEAGDYTSGLAELAQLKDSVDGFFDDVLVMCDDISVQNNRIALLQRLRNIFLKVADISFLHTS
ncbi:MAG: glycine--tRNA ligase subunit beta [SAR86 cluster bacterium]|uniref:Glycine--tRNA ligase beta subunit n=1 Tax=SAR86 cluster bacterium TaxID=2030880 RepID=A0A2A4X489_9GAMM|nr:MAG: glycine--tRNA ligase subunit beta [SAR86 cluster bacterium]